MTTTTTRTVAPECYVITDDRGTYYAAMDWDEGEPIGTRDRDMARTYPTREAAEETAAMIRGCISGGPGGRPFAAIVKRRPAETETVITDEGRALVAARRAARKAERGW